LAISLERQIIGRRFIIPALLFQLILVFYTYKKYNTLKQKINLTAFTGSFLTFYYIYKYLITPHIIDVSTINENIALMLRTNSILYYIFQ